MSEFMLNYTGEEINEKLSQIGEAYSWNDLTDKPFGDDIELIEVASASVTGSVNTTGSVSSDFWQSPRCRISISTFVKEDTAYQLIIDGKTFDGKSHLVNDNLWIGNPYVYGQYAYFTLSKDEIIAKGYYDTGEDFVLTSGMALIIADTELPENTPVIVVVNECVDKTITIDKKYLPEQLQFGEETKVVNEPLNLTWDGNTDGLLCVDNVLYKVSDLVLTDEQNQSAIVAYSDGWLEIAANTWDTAVSDGFVTEDFVYVCEGLCCIKKDNVMLNEISFPEAGLYFIKYDEEFYTSSVTITEPVEHIKTVVQTIDKKYIPRIALYADSGNLYHDENCIYPVYKDELIAIYDEYEIIKVHSDGSIYLALAFSKYDDYAMLEGCSGAEFCTAEYTPK